MSTATQLGLGGLTFPAPPRRRRWPRRSRWEQLSLAIAGTPLALWRAPDSPPPSAKVIPLPVLPVRSPPPPAPPPTKQDLFAKWEAILEAEGMPALVNRDTERPKDPHILDEDLPTMGSGRPLRRRGGVDGDGMRVEPGVSFGAWWLSEPDAEGAERWGRLSDEVREIVEAALKQAHAADLAELRARAFDRAAMAATVLVGYGLPVDERGLRRRLRLADRFGRRCVRAHEAARRARKRSVLTGPQARVLRLWFEGWQQTEIAAIEGHSKVTVHHKLHRALARLGEVIRARVGADEAAAR